MNEQVVQFDMKQEGVADGQCVCSGYLVMHAQNHYFLSIRLTAFDFPVPTGIAHTDC